MLIWVETYVSEDFTLFHRAMSLGNTLQPRYIYQGVLLNGLVGIYSFITFMVKV